MASWGENDGLRQVLPEEERRPVRGGGFAIAVRATKPNFVAERSPSGQEIVN